MVIIFDKILGKIRESDMSYTNPAYPSFKTVKDALDYLLISTPVISLFTNNIGTVEIGTVVDSIQLDWQLNKDVSQLQSLTIDNGIGDVMPYTTGAIGQYTLFGTFTSNLIFKLIMDDGVQSTSKRSYVNFNKARFWGKIDHKTNITDSDIKSLTGAGIGTGKDLIKSLPKDFSGMDMEGEYFIYVYAEELGSPLFKINGLLNGDFTMVRNDAFTNDLGITYNIKAWVSNNPFGLMNDFQVISN